MVLQEREGTPLGGCEGTRWDNATGARGEGAPRSGGREKDMMMEKIGGTRSGEEEDDQ
jgi:hypothetical protein